MSSPPPPSQPPSQSSSSSSAIREDLVGSAVRFLSDPKVQSSPLAKRIAFLESKGLTSDEIEEALKRSKNPSASSAASASPSAPPPVPAAPGYIYPGHPGYQPIPQNLVTKYTWKDYFVIAAASGSVGYGIYHLVKTYIVPRLPIPTTTELESSRQSLESSLSTTSQQLTTLHESTSKVLESITKQTEELSSELKSLNTVIDSLKESETKRNEEVGNVKDELDKLKELVPKLLESSKASQTTLLNDLHSEIRSLKSMLLNRRAIPSVPSSVPASTAASTTTTPPSELAKPESNASGTKSDKHRDTETQGPVKTNIKPNPPIPLGKPKIPAWQLTSASNDTTSSSNDTDNNDTESTGSTDKGQGVDEAVVEAKPADKEDSKGGKENKKIEQCNGGAQGKWETVSPGKKGKKRSG